MGRFVLLPVLVLALACSGDGPLEPLADREPLSAMAAVKPAPSLDNTIQYVFTGHLGNVDAEGRLQVWAGTIEGDIAGQMKWWFVPGGGPPNMPATAHVGHYEARWEIWDGSDLLLAGQSAGTTAQPKGKDGIWRGSGRVTEAGAGYEAWLGRHIFEGGNVDWAFPYSGQGIFRIN
jgi:hypothetical protein